MRVEPDVVLGLIDDVDRLRLISRDAVQWRAIAKREAATLRRQRDVLLDMLVRSGVRYADIARAIDRDARDVMEAVGAKEDAAQQHGARSAT